MSADLKRYLELQAVMAGLLAVHKISAIDQPEYQSAWGESENIKNKYGGMPPRK